MAPEVLATDPGRSFVFTIDEFARLLVLLSTDDCLRQELLASWRGLSREQLDQGVSINEFCSTKVHAVFNARDVRLVFEFEEPLREVQSSRLPPYKRTSDELMTQYSSIRSQLTRCYQNWKKSSQNSPYILRFCPKSPRSALELSSAGRKCYLRFSALRCDKTDERNCSLDFTLRMIPLESMADTCESRSRIQEARDSRRQRKRDTTEVFDEAV